MNRLLLIKEDHKTVVSYSPWYKKYLMRISVDDRLLFKFQLTGVFTTALNAHGAIMVTIDLSQYDIVYRGGDFAPLKCFTIFKLQINDTHWIKLYRTPPKLPFEIRITPKFPASSITVTSYNHRVVAHLIKSLL